MDMQTRLICNYEIYDAQINQYVPLNCREEKIKKVINRVNYRDGDLGDEFILFKEHMKVSIMLESDDPSAIVCVETYSNDEIIKVKSGTIIELSSGGDHEKMFVPGYYSISIKDSQGIFKGFYKIIPSSIEWEELLNLREYVEKMIKGLSYNVYKQRNILLDKHSQNNMTIFQKYKCIHENYDTIFNNMNGILCNPLIDIEKKYEVKSYCKKPDKKSQKWLMKKGQKYNPDLITPTLSYEKHSQLSYDNDENRMLKKILESINEILYELYNSYNIVCYKLEDKIIKIEKQIIQIEAYSQSIKEILNIKKAKKDIENKLVGLKSERDKFEKKRKNIYSNLNDVIKMKNFISYCINETWLKYIQSNRNAFKPTIRLIKNKYYGRLYEVFREINNIEDNPVNANVFFHKKTSKLFEIYNYILIEKIFEELGYEWVDGWLKSHENITLHNSDLISGQAICLVKNDYKIELVYDNEIKRINEVKKSNQSQLAAPINIRSRRPDILINMYKKNKYIGSSIVEIKCRKKNSIYNEMEDTDVMYQLVDYDGIIYYDAETRKICKNPIKKLIVLYVKHEGSYEFTDDLYDFSFIPIGVINSNEKPYGYNEVKDKLQEFEKILT